MNWFGWTLVAGAWALSFYSLRLARRMQKRNEQARQDAFEALANYERLREITVRAMDRADWALNGIEFVLKWAGVNDIPSGVVDGGHDPRGSVEESPQDGGQRLPEIQGGER